ncbi:hypothetical protein Calkr_0661 [Caldicellulosiruptor acetigenus I77R1B]|uniref:Uncharacterized protein n=2 Tax=Caldicellulosiruptor acetigenus TaxID=301953 RepID=G2PTJ8_9FIRM|nr:hypothetical protein [Caldicellulosiruptor acetigenus]ADQ40200.1 hypothetical protein Calkr_0661 [Caldicellulosiruptor acetigenus I77R1B]AEM74279.1 hypothetical protein Calla_1685 [Caldicellulosiruptor acetigenus 6A]
MITIEKVHTNDVFERVFSQLKMELVSYRSNEILKDQECLKTKGMIEILEAKLKEFLNGEALKIYKEIGELQSYLCGLYKLYGYKQGLKDGARLGLFD